MAEEETSVRKARDEWRASCDSTVKIHDLDGRGYLYVKGELLVAARDLDRLRDAASSFAEITPQGGSGELGIVRTTFSATGDARDEDLKVPDVLARVRDRQPTDLPPIRVGPNHVLSGEPEYQGGPATVAKSTAHGLTFTGVGRGRGTRVAVLDTGYTRGVHPVMDGRVVSTGTPRLDSEPADGRIDFEAGHGTFVAGMVLHRAPRARVHVVEVLGPAGYGTEYDIAHAILAHRGAHVINLSLGGYSEGDRPPHALEAALRKVDHGTAVVAAAGNNSCSRPMWPAAFKQVYAVGAVEHDGRRAEYSNYGWWVDACTYATNLTGPFPRFDAATAANAAAPFFEGWAIWSGTSFAAPKVSGEIVARLSTGQYANARDAAAHLINDPSRPHVPDLGTLLAL